jgi:putative DNA primase/helicase
MNETNPHLAAALDYTARGWYVIPVHGIDPNGHCTCRAKTDCEQPGKHPILPGGYKSGTTDPTIIRRWWQTYPLANIGIVCGQPSGIWVLDIDGHEGINTLEQYETTHGPLPETITARTGSGGLHLIWKWNDGQILRTRIRAHPGIDIKAGGGHIVAPPSRHANGRRYQWETPPAHGGDNLVYAPDQLVRWLKNPRALNSGDHSDSGNGHTPDFPSVDEMLRNGLPEGQRDDGIFHAALTLHRAGLHPHETEQLIQQIAARCQPPFPPEEAQRKIEQARKHHEQTRATSVSGGWADPVLTTWAANITSTSTSTSDSNSGDNGDSGTGTGTGGSPLWPGFGQATDDNLAARLKTLWHDARPLQGGGWIIYNGQTWQHAERPLRAATARLVQTLHQELALTSSDRHETIQKAITRAETANTIKAVLTLLETETTPGYVLTRDNLDPDPWALGVLNGVLDLRTGQLREYRREDMITRQTNVEWHGPDVECPLFVETLHMAVRDEGPDRAEEIVAATQLFFGICLTGVSFKNFAVMHGPGNTGKSTIIEAYAWTLGEYAGVIPRGILTTRKHGHDPHPTALTELEGRRFVYTTEPGPGETLNAELIKELTGGTVLKARRMYGNWYEFRATAKPLIDTNNPLQLRDVSKALEERMVLIPMLSPIPSGIRRKRDAVMDDLRREGPGILAWAWQGLRRLLDAEQTQAIGGGDISPLLGATLLEDRHETVEDDDILGQWMNECLRAGGPANFASTRDLYDSYTYWCAENGHSPWSKIGFSRNLSARLRAGVTLLTGDELTDDGGETVTRRYTRGVLDRTQRGWHELRIVRKGLSL